MKHIKNAITFKIDLPSQSALEEHLKKQPFCELCETQALTAGFVPVIDDRLVFPFPGGYAFRLRIDEKILPASAINKELNSRVELLEQAYDGKLPPKEKNNVRDEVILSLLKVALSQSKYVMAYYRLKDRLLMVDTVNKTMANILTNRLVHAVGSIKATMIYISGVSNGLTAKLHSMLTGGEGLAGFEIGGVCKLKGEEGKTLSFNVHDIQESKAGLLEALEQACKVVELELINQDISFRLNEKFVKKSIRFTWQESEYEPDDEIDEFTHQACEETLKLANACNQLLTLFEYKEPVAEGGAA